VPVFSSAQPTRTWFAAAICVVACTTGVSHGSRVTPTGPSPVVSTLNASTVPSPESISILPQHVSAEKACQVTNSWLFAMATENAEELERLSSPDLLVMGLVVEGH
jgi:hypothetical protein